MSAAAARPRAFSRRPRSVASAGDDLERIYALQDLAKGDCIFAATGVTDGSLLKGVHRRKDCVTTESIVMRASSGTVRRVATEYRKFAGERCD